MSKRRSGRKLSSSEALIFLIVLVIVGFFYNRKTTVETTENHDITPDTAVEVPLSDTKKQDGVYNYVHFIDAGQGDCTLIETSDGQFALIDASTDTATEKIIDYLSNEGVEELEFVIFTHPHEDHIGSGDDILRSFDVKTVYMTNKTENTATYSSLINEIKNIKANGSISVFMPKNGDTFSLGDLEFTVISDGKKFMDDSNNSSICVRAELGETSLLFTGDAETKVENAILESNFEIDSDIYKCAHHGSSTSNSDAFLDEVTPKIAVVSCGKDNSYGHPHDETVTAMAERNIPLLRTDIHGDIVIAFDDDSFFVESANAERAK